MLRSSASLGPPFSRHRLGFGRGCLAWHCLGFAQLRLAWCRLARHCLARLALAFGRRRLARRWPAWRRLAWHRPGFGRHRLARHCLARRVSFCAFPGRLYVALLGVGQLGVALPGIASALRDRPHSASACSVTACLASPVLGIASAARGSGQSSCCASLGRSASPWLRATLPRLASPGAALPCSINQSINLPCFRLRLGFAQLRLARCRVGSALVRSASACLASACLASPVLGIASVSRGFAALLASPRAVSPCWSTPWPRAACLTRHQLARRRLAWCLPDFVLGIGLPGIALLGVSSTSRGFASLGIALRGFTRLAWHHHARHQPLDVAMRGIGALGDWPA